MNRNSNEVLVIKFGRDTVNEKAQRIGREILEQVRHNFCLLKILKNKLKDYNGAKNRARVQNFLVVLLNKKQIQ